MVRHADTGGARLVALTFDDGPGDWTPEILDLLAAHGARSTFFVLGQSIAGREDALRRLVTEGHEIGNHTWSHTNPARLAEDELRDELARTSALVEGVAGVRPRLARPPYGTDFGRFAAVAAELGMQTVLWSVNPRDWTEPPAGEIVRRTLAGLAPGAIVDLHDGFRRGSSGRTRLATVDAVAELLPALAADGYRCVTVSELQRA